jgi:hypothetical protein
MSELCDRTKSTDSNDLISDQRPFHFCSSGCGAPHVLKFWAAAGSRSSWPSTGPQAWYRRRRVRVLLVKRVRHAQGSGSSWRSRPTQSATTKKAPAPGPDGRSGEGATQPAGPIPNTRARARPDTPPPPKPRPPPNSQPRRGTWSPSTRQPPALMVPDAGRTGTRNPPGTGHLPRVESLHGRCQVHSTKYL